MPGRAHGTGKGVHTCRTAPAWYVLVFHACSASLSRPRWSTCCLRTPSNASCTAAKSRGLRLHAKTLDMVHDAAVRLTCCAAPRATMTFFRSCSKVARASWSTVSTLETISGFVAQRKSGLIVIDVDGTRPRPEQIPDEAILNSITRIRPRLPSDGCSVGLARIKLLFEQSSRLSRDAPKGVNGGPTYMPATQKSLAELEDKLRCNQRSSG